LPKIAAAAAVAVSLLLAGAPASAAAPVPVPGTRVTLEPPPGFTLAERFPGFGDGETGASILVTEMPAPVEGIRAGLTAEGLATRGMTLLSTATVTTPLGETFLVGATQRAGGAAVGKWLAVSGDAAGTTMVLATWPLDREAMAEPLRLAVLSARPLGAAADRLAGLPFRLTEGPRLRISERVANALVLTEEGRRGVRAPGEPLLVATASLSEVDLDDLAAFAERRLRQTEQVTGPWRSEGRAADVGGMAGWELEASATDGATGAPMRLYQLVLRDRPRSYFIVQALVAPERWAEMLPEVRAVAHSVRRAE
jgi:hypothetical protein